jgi:hypothetical protein
MPVSSNFLRLLDVYAANVLLLLHSGDRRLETKLRHDFDAIREHQKTDLPAAGPQLIEVLLAHEALMSAVDAGAPRQKLDDIHAEHQLALAHLRALAAA